jgi:cell shape-determining protein MreC
MADDEGEAIENALNTVVTTLEKSANMKKELKQSILDTVSTLRNLFVKLLTNCESKTTKIRELEAEVTKVKADQNRATGISEKASDAPSVIQSQVPDGLGEHGGTSVFLGQEITGQLEREALPSIQRQGTPQQREW